MDVNEVIAAHDTPREERLFLRFEGTVQGVGFRWTTQDLARKAGVAGWVRNMDDGSVEAELQGSGTAIGAVLAGLRDQYATARTTYFFLRHLGFRVTTCRPLAPRELPEGKRDFVVRE